MARGTSEGFTKKKVKVPKEVWSRASAVQLLRSVARIDLPIWGDDSVTSVQAHGPELISPAPTQKPGTVPQNLITALRKQGEKDPWCSMDS